jgi:hypothetical protein
MAQRRRDPIRRVELADGRVRYRFVVDVGREADGRRDQRTQTFDTLRQARVERARIISEWAAGLLVRPDRQLTAGGFLGRWLESKPGPEAGDTPGLCPSAAAGHPAVRTPAFASAGRAAPRRRSSGACSPVSCGGRAVPVRRCRRGW